MSSVAGRIGIPLGSIYSSSKFAVEGLSEAVRGELKKFNVHVILVEPGFINTKFKETSEAKADRFVANKDTPYHSLIVHHHNRFKALEASAPGPEEAAEVIYKAMTEDEPKVRYTVTANAGKLMMMKKIMPEKMFEKMMDDRHGTK